MLPSRCINIDQKTSKFEVSGAGTRRLAPGPREQWEVHTGYHAAVQVQYSQFSDCECGKTTGVCLDF